MVCALGRFVPWVVLCHVSLWAVGRFVPWVVLSLGRFELGSYWSLCRFELGSFRAWAVSWWAVLSLGRFVMEGIVCTPQAFPSGIGMCTDTNHYVPWLDIPYLHTILLLDVLIVYMQCHRMSKNGRLTRFSQGPCHHRNVPLLYLFFATSRKKKKWLSIVWKYCTTQAASWLVVQPGGRNSRSPDTYWLRRYL